MLCQVQGTHRSWNLLHTAASGPAVHAAHTETGSAARVGGAATEENNSVQEMIITVSIMNVTIRSVPEESRIIRYLHNISNI